MRNRTLTMMPGLCVLLLCLGANAEEKLSLAVTAANGSVEQIPATAFRPDGTGPFPAVVIMHDCSGLGRGSSGAPARWARELVARGYYVFIPDSFSTRGFPGGVCTTTASRDSVAPSRRIRDAYAALAHLRTLPEIDGRHVGIMGGSHGGSTTVTAMAAPLRDSEPLTQEKHSGFAAAVALYPGCAARMGSWHADLTGTYRPVAPLLVLIGEKDDWTPAEHCRRMIESASTAGYPASIRIYPGAHHSFDSASPVRYVAARNNANAPGKHGATTGGNPEAWADSIREVMTFFEDRLH